MTSCQILVVEDDLDVREAMIEALEIAGYDTVGVENGRDALAFMKSKRPKLVVLDLMMPVLDGWEVMRQMRADRELADIPVCVLSAISNQAPPSSVNALEKPVQLLRLLTTVRRYCDG
jgi:two-component system, chemotaxis family, chemotaxis protein CheY